jgi:hypothetical protein
MSMKVKGPADFHRCRQAVRDASVLRTRNRYRQIFVFWQRSNVLVSDAGCAVIHLAGDSNKLNGAEGEIGVRLAPPCGLNW